MKQRIRLTESQLHRMIKESVRQALNEAGHLYWEDEDGVTHTNSKELWRGVPGAIYVYHGEWSDPEIIYKNKSINYWDAEESLELSFQSDVEDGEFEGSFEEWVSNQDKRYLASLLDDLVWALDGCK